jgi:hypothetical protein
MQSYSIKHGLLMTLIICWPFPVVASDTATPAWEIPREISTFSKLLSHSPFSLPTAEESSPLAERYAMTGIITLNGEDQIFVFDRTDQSRELLTAKPNAKNMSLLSLVREANNPIKASIRIGSEVGTIGFMEAGNATAAVQPGAPAPGSPSSANAPATGVTLPALPPLPQSPASNPQGRRIIRRPVVTAPQTPQPSSP